MTRPALLVALILGSVCPGPMVRAQAGPPLPAHWYRFEGGAPAGVISDAVGALHGSVAGPAIVLAGACGDGLRLPPGAEANLGPTLGNVGENDFTLALWINLGPGSGVVQVLSKRTACGDTAPSMDLRLVDNTLVFSLADGAVTTALSSTTFIRTGNWRMLTLVRAAGTLSLYLDGQSVRSAAQAAVVNPNSSGDFRIGGGPCVGQGGVLPLDGAVDELQVFTSALSPSQILALFQRRSLLLRDQPVGIGACPGSGASFTAVLPAPGAGATFTWQAETLAGANIWAALTSGSPAPGGAGIVSISTAPSGHASTLTLAGVGAGDDRRYRCMVVHPCGSFPSAPASLSLVPCCTADFNADGNLDPDDLSDYITCFFTQAAFPGACPQADFNTDGNIDPDDLSDYITAFFAGC